MPENLKRLSDADLRYRLAQFRSRRDAYPVGRVPEDIFRQINAILAELETR